MEPMSFCDENVQQALQEVREDPDIGIVYNTPLHAEIGINGKLEFAEIDGASVIVRMQGKFADTRQKALERLEQYLKARIPEISSVEVEDPAMLDETNNWEGDGDPDFVEDVDDPNTIDEIWMQVRPVGAVPADEGDRIRVAGTQIGEEVWDEESRKKAGKSSYEADIPESGDQGGLFR